MSQIKIEINGESELQIKAAQAFFSVLSCEKLPAVCNALKNAAPTSDIVKASAEVPEVVEDDGVKKMSQVEAEAMVYADLKAKFNTVSPARSQAAFIKKCIKLDLIEPTPELEFTRQPYTTTVEAKKELETEEAEETEEGPAIYKIEDIRAALASKINIGDNRKKIKNMLIACNAKNVSTLSEEFYTLFVDFLNGLD